MDKGKTPGKEALQLVTSLLGILQRVAKASPTLSPHLQPLYAWEQKLMRRCKPKQLVRFLAKQALSMILGPPVPPFRQGLTNGCHGVVMRGITEQGAAFDVVEVPAPFLEHTWPARRIAALELLRIAPTVYVRCRQGIHPPDGGPYPLRTDNAYAASKRSAKKWPCSALLELSAQGLRIPPTFGRTNSPTWTSMVLTCSAESQWWTDSNLPGSCYRTS